MYLSKTQKKKQQTELELALVSLADLDGFYRAANHAENAGQIYDLWLKSAGKKTLLSWSSRAISKGYSAQQSEPEAPDASEDSSIQRASGPSRELQQSNSVGGAQSLPPNSARKGSKNSKKKFGGCNDAKQAAEVVDLSVDVLLRKLKGSGINEGVLCEKFNGA